MVELSGLKGLFYGPATLRLCDSGLGKSVYGDAGILTYFCSRLKTFASFKLATRNNVLKYITLLQSFGARCLLPNCLDTIITIMLLGQLLDRTPQVFSAGHQPQWRAQHYNHFF